MLVRHLMEAVGVTVQRRSNGKGISPTKKKPKNKNIFTLIDWKVENNYNPGSIEKHK